MTSRERVVIVGCGLIGTSIAMAARRAGDVVTGVDVDERNAAAAAERAGIRVSTDEEAFADASIVVIATPTAVAADRVRHALRVAPGATVTDVASVKAPVISAVTEGIDPAEAARFVPGHPMGGSERSGPETASASFVDGITWVVAPHEGIDPSRMERVEAWIRRLGATPVRVTPQRHDRLVATVSHLPQIASTTLMSLASSREGGEADALLLAAGGFRDLTRLAASRPELWGEILTANRDEVIDALDAFAAALEELRARIAEGDRPAVEEAFARGRTARLTLAAKPRVRSGVAVLQVPIPDRPGALAGVTVAVAGINIEDLQIVHSSEGGRGVVHLTVATDDVPAAERALGEAGLESLRIA